MDDVILTETAGGVRTITLNRPGARNALSGGAHRPPGREPRRAPPAAGALRPAPRRRGRRTVQAINATYRDVAATTLGEGLELERRRFADWKLSPADVEARRQAVIDRGRSKLG